jgi:hypothetical protein
MPEHVEDLYKKCVDGMIPTNDMIRRWLINLEERVRKLESQSQGVAASSRRTNSVKAK